MRGRFTSGVMLALVLGGGVIAACVSHSNAQPTATGEWSGVVDCDYGASHGWGHVYRCRIREVRDGVPSLSEFSLNAAVYGECMSGRDCAENPRRWLPENEQAPLRGVVMRFRRSDRPYGPPSGYKDPETSIYWVLVSAQIP